MSGIWLKAACLRCGKHIERKYYAKTVDEIEITTVLLCGCGNSDKSRFRIVDMETKVSSIGSVN